MRKYYHRDHEDSRRKSRERNRKRAARLGPSYNNHLAEPKTLKQQMRALDFGSTKWVRRVDFDREKQDAMSAYDEWLESSDLWRCLESGHISS